MSLQVCDPMRDSEEWHTVDASTDIAAVRAYLMIEEYSVDEYEPHTAHYLLVRDDEHDQPRRVTFRVIPACFEVS